MVRGEFHIINKVLGEAVPYLTKDIHLAQPMKSGKFSLATKNPPNRVDPMTTTIERVIACFMLKIVAPISMPMALLMITNKDTSRINMR